MDHSKITTLGIRLGANSLGWCLIETTGEPCSDGRQGEFVAIGTRVFSTSEIAGRNPKSGEPLAVVRREARAKRRKRDRYLRRRSALLKALVKHGLMPSNKKARQSLLIETSDAAAGSKSNDVYSLRAKALDVKLSPEYIGRVFFSINQRRGYKSNRRATDGVAEDKLIGRGVSKLDAAMMDHTARTYGEFLYQRRLNGHEVRVRLRSGQNDTTSSVDYDFFPTRTHLEAEFDAICSKQAQYHPKLLDKRTTDEIRTIIFSQRALKKIIPRKCSYHPEQDCLPKSHLLVQEFELLSRLNGLRLIGGDQVPVQLEPNQRDRLYNILERSKAVTFSRLQQALNLGPDLEFFNESKKQRTVKGNQLIHYLTDEQAFGKSWDDFDREKQNAILCNLREQEDPITLKDWLQDNTQLDNMKIDVVSNISLPTGFSRFGKTALESLIEDLRFGRSSDGKVVSEKEALSRVYDDLAKYSNLKAMAHDNLPFYQEVIADHIVPGSGNANDPYDVSMGKFGNPTLHIAFNQLRRVVNAIVNQYGKPKRIIIQIGQELKVSHKPLNEVRNSWSKTERISIAISQKLRNLGVEETSENRMRLKLWQQLPEVSGERICVYSGLPIPITRVFSDDVYIDHILPYSSTLDDSQANRILCLSKVRRQKLGKFPANVDAWRPRYEEILKRSKRLAKNQRMRFFENAMEQFSGKGGIRSYHLVDQSFIARASLCYLNSLYSKHAIGKKNFEENAALLSVPARLTEKLRRDWNLNGLLSDGSFTETDYSHHRKDYRHRAIDAAVVACTSVSLLDQLVISSQKLETSFSSDVIRCQSPPWDGFPDQLAKAVNKVIVSHKADHGTIPKKDEPTSSGQTAGQLHNDTAYGLIGSTDNPLRVTRRKSIESFTTQKQLENIKDLPLKEKLMEVTKGLSGRAFVEAIFQYAGSPGPNFGMRRIRVVESARVIPIFDPNGQSYKGYKGDSNYRFDVWELKDGKWVAEVVSTFDAHQKRWRSQINRGHPTAKKVLSLMQGDMVAYMDEEGNRVISRVIKFSNNGQLSLAAHHESGDLKRRDAMPTEFVTNSCKAGPNSTYDPFKYLSPTAGGLKERRTRQVRVDTLGRVFDSEA